MNSAGRRHRRILPKFAGAAIVFALALFTGSGRLFAQGPTITTAALPDGIVNTPYQADLAVSGASGVTIWTATGLPASLSIDIASGHISGTPTAVGSFTVNVRVTDALLRTATKSFGLKINTALAITTTSPLPAGMAGTAYSQTLAASGGTAPYDWAVTAGNLPAGLALNAGVISGTPSAPGTASFTVQASDHSSPPQAVTKPLTVTINPGPLVITIASLPTGTVGTAYSATLDASGGTGNRTWSISAGSLPAGLSLSGNAIIGTPTAAGAASFTVQVTDSATPPVSATKLLSISIAPQALVINTGGLPGGIVGIPYSATLDASGGTGNKTWSISAGSLPAGLSLSGNAIAGTPTTASPAVNFTVQVTDSATPPVTATKAFSIAVSPFSGPVPGITVTGLPAAANTAQQIPLGVSLASPYPNPITGELTMTFTSSALVPVDDAMTQFSTGSRTVSFSIPPNTTTAVFNSQPRLMTGTVAGTVNFSIRVQNDPTNIPAGSIAIGTAAPALSNVVVKRTATGIDVQVSGYSAERRMISADFGFDVKTASGTQRVNLTRNVQSDFATWYQNPASAQFGSSFLFVQSFTVAGDASQLDSVIVALTNGQGSTSFTAVKIPAN